MAYDQNTIISANAANAYVTVLKGLLIDAGWTLVDSGVPSGTYAFEVYESAAEDNQAGYDWFLSIQWNTVGTESTVDILVGGAYDIVNHRMSQIPMGPDSNELNWSTGSNNYADSVSGDLFGYIAVNVATSATRTFSSTGRGSFTGGAPTKKWHSVIVPSSAFGYWMSVTLDHVGIATTILTNTMFVASTLDLDAEWIAQEFPKAVNPIICSWNNSTGGSSLEGVSASMIGPDETPTSTNYLRPVTARNSNIGSPLPILDGSYFPAYAWRSAYYVASASGLGGSPAWDNPAFGNGIHIGDAIDWWAVHNGSIGDTVEIDGGTYVLTGPRAGTTGLCAAFLVE